MASFIVNASLPSKRRRAHFCSRKPIRACEVPSVAAREERPATIVAEPQLPPAELVAAPSLTEFAEQRAAGLTAPFIVDENSEWSDAWTLAVAPRKANELKNQYSRVGILIKRNFADFGPAPGAEERYNQASLEDISRAKARTLYDATGLPSVAETHDLAIDAPESGSKINKTLQQGYYTRDVEGEGDAMIDRVRPISDENRATRFNSCVAYFDGEMEIVTNGKAVVAITYSAARYATIAVASAFDELYRILTRRLGLTLDRPRPSNGYQLESTEVDEKRLVGATMLRERLVREGKMLKDGIVKVSSFLNHMVDVDLMEECGRELAERLRSTMPNKVLTVESTGLIPGLPTARALGIPLLFARKTRPITISDSYQTTYRSATKGVSSELVVSCEYLQPGDRILIIDDFLAGGSTAEALFKLANMAHAKVVGLGVLIEKMASGGRVFLSGYDVPVESLAKIDAVKEGQSKDRLIVVEEEPWVSEAMKKCTDDQMLPTKGDSQGYGREMMGKGKYFTDGDGRDSAEFEEDMAPDVVDIGVDDDDDDEFDNLQEELIRSAPR